MMKAIQQFTSSLSILAHMAEVGLMPDQEEGLQSRLA
jgi:hypothetical protein